MDHQVKLLCLEMFSANPAGLVQSPFMTHILPATLHRQVNTAALIQYLHTNTPWRWQRSTEITLSGCTESNPSSWSKITAAHNSSSDQRMLQRVNTACRPCGSSRTAPHRTERTFHQITSEETASHQYKQMALSPVWERGGITHWHRWLTAGTWPLNTATAQNKAVITSVSPTDLHKHSWGEV